MAIFVHSFLAFLMRYFIHLSYRGSRFHGWQRQKNANSVQEEIEKALEIVLKKSVGLIGCGRTDTGVHAQSFYAHFDWDDLSDSQFVYTLNSILPKDIAIREVYKTSDTLHARFSAVSRSYRYYIHYQKNPFLTDRSYFFRQPVKPDVKLMNEFCQKLIHIQDFASFEKKGSDNTNSLCRVTNAYWAETEDGCMMNITANRFLRNMVRAIVGTSLMIGCEKENTEDIMQEVNKQTPIHLRMTAPACGLHLMSVEYPEKFEVL